jgi:NAD(P)-dependent dehydrogenase (short-subunit alcohol dehydrogenase family)
VVTGAASGIGLGLAERFAGSGLNIVMADVEEQRLADAAAKVRAVGVEVLAVPVDVTVPESVDALADAAFKHFGGAHVVCNNAGVATKSDPWFGPISAWEWVMGVNFWGVVHGIRAFLPRLVEQGEGHIVNTASVAGLLPGFAPSYDASKHAVVAITEDLYRTVKLAGFPVGVSVVCPGWVNTSILDAERNWPDRLGGPPPPAIQSDVVDPRLRETLRNATAPEVVAALVADAVEADRFWVFTESEFLEIAVRRWTTIGQREDPAFELGIPGLPSAGEVLEELQRRLGGGA